MCVCWEGNKVRTNYCEIQGLCDSIVGQRMFYSEASLFSEENCMLS